ncbi:MAG: hypothetical protein AAFR38_00605 [Planctomycetota bacterium]
MIRTLALAGLALTQNAAAQNLLVPIPAPDGVDVPRFRAAGTAINADGSAVTGDIANRGGPTTGSFFWRRGDGTRIIGPGPFGLEITAATDLAADGSVVVGRGLLPPDLHVPVRWTEAGGLEDIPLPPIALDGAALNVNANGSVTLILVTVEDDQLVQSDALLLHIEGRGFLRVEVEDLGRPVVDTGPRPGATLSGDGRTVFGVIETTEGFAPFRWTEKSGAEVLEGSGGIDAPSVREFNAASADGSVAVGVFWDGGLRRGFRWTESGGFEPLPDGPFDRFGEAIDCSADGEVVVSGGSLWTPVDGTRSFARLADRLFPFTGDVEIDTGDMRAVSADGRTFTGHAFVRDNVNDITTEAFAMTLERACSDADFEFPRGVLSHRDVTTFVERYLGSSPTAARLAEPFGSATSADIDRFVDLFFEGCPGL